MNKFSIVKPLDWCAYRNLIQCVWGPSGPGPVAQILILVDTLFYSVVQHLICFRPV